MRRALCGSTVALLLAAGCTGGPDFSEEDELTPLRIGDGFRVLEIVSPDTLGIDLDGNGYFDPGTESVQMLGVLGVNYTADRIEYPAREAVAYLQRLLLDQVVILEDDRKELGIYRQNPPPDYDLHTGEITREGGPWLAYVYIGDVLVNRDVLERGFGRLRAMPDCGKRAWLRDAEARARKKKIGVWEFR